MFVSHVSVLASIAVGSTITFATHISHESLPRGNNNTGITVPLKATYTPAGTFLDVEVTIGEQTFLMLVDTGSSDTWLPRKGFQCLDSDNVILPQEKCMFGNTYETSSTFELIPNQTFGVKYGSGISSGILGFETVTVGGLSVERQIIGVSDRTTDEGNGFDSGVIGLAYPFLTSAHPGDDYSNDSYSFWSDRIPYNPWFTSLYKQGSVEPFFSFALTRTPVNVSNGDGGFLSLGRLPPVKHSSTFSVSPVEIIKDIPPFFTNNETAKTYWALSVKSTHIDSSVSTYESWQALVDSGNFFNFFPSEVAASVNAAFKPPATPASNFNESALYDVTCDAIAPRFGMTFWNNVTIYMDQQDTIVQNADGTCTSAFLDADVFSAVSGAEGLSINIIGTPFLRSVVSVFDFGKDEIRFAERGEGGANGTLSPTVSATPISTSQQVSGVSEPVIKVELLVILAIPTLAICLHFI